jgi:hypothetical protein
MESNGRPLSLGLQDHDFGSDTGIPWNERQVETVQRVKGFRHIGPSGWTLIVGHPWLPLRPNCGPEFVE